MTFEEATILITMHYVFTLIFIGKRYFLSFKQTVFLISALAVNVFLIVITHYPYFVINFLFIYSVEWFLSSRSMSNKLLPLLFLFLQYSLSITTFYITYDFQNSTHIGLVFPPIRLFIIQACTILILIFSVLILIEKYRLLEKLYFSKKKFEKISFFLFLLLLIMFISHALITNSSYYFLSLFSVIIVLIVLIIIAVTLLVYSKINRLNTDNIILQKTLHSQQELYEFSREFQHDLKSLLIGVDSYLSDNNIEAARILLHKISTEGKDTINQQYLSQLSAIDNLPIKATFYQFTATSTEKKIPFQFNINTDFKDISIELLDFLRCVSIMLNNAIEAKTPENENYFISIDAFKTKKSTHIVIKNPITKNFKLSYIFKKGFSTKNQHQGLGLSNLRKIVNKNKKIELHYSLKRSFLIAELIILD